MNVRLRSYTGFPAAVVCFEAVAVAMATTVPELGASVGLGVVVPFNLVVPARPGV